MNISFTRLRSLLAFMAICTGLTAASAADLGDPIVTFHSTAYEEVGESNKFSLFISSKEPSTYTFDMGDYKIEFDVEPGTVDTTEGTWVGTWVPVHVNAQGDVKIYGDADLLEVLSIDGGYLTSIDLGKCYNLEVLSLQHNVLEDLDLTPYTNLCAIYLTDNPFTGPQSLTIGAGKPYLSILEIDIIDKMAPGFNLSDYPLMGVFDAYHNFGITEIDTSGCPNLLSLSLEMTAVEKLDVSNNTKLRSLNISESRITDIDISMLPDLLIFLAGHDSGWVNQGYRLNSIDLTHNPELFYLSVSGNRLGSLDLTQNTKLTHLMAGRNSLRELDLTQNTELYSVSVVFNDMDFATLPWPEATWGEYWYMQNDLSVAKSIAKGTEIDLSGRVLREGTTTTASVWVSPVGADEYELDAADWTYSNGRVAINKALSDSVYVKFTNDVFYEYSMRTSKFRVKEASEMGKPSLILNMNVDPTDARLRFSVGMSGATPETPKKFYVELATDVLTEYETTFADEPDGWNVDIAMPADYNGNVNIYIPEGEVMTSFAVVDQTLTAVNLTNATELRRLTLNGCGLYGLNLGYNRCLRYLDVSNNELTLLDLQGVYGNYTKNVLSTVKASHNQLTSYDSFKFNDTATFRYIDLSYNQLESFKLLEFENLDYVDLSHNQLSEELYLTYQISASHIDLSHNQLPSVVIDYFTNLDLLDLSYNAFPYPSLPLPSAVNAQGSYIYAPQKEYELPAKAPAINLSDMNLVIDGEGTTFTWMTADGTVLEQGVQIDCVDGVTRFLDTSLGKLHCVMSNPAFPDFTGENEYRTTDIQPMDFPTEIVATFTTTEDSETGDVTFTASRRTELYIDWRGDGTELIAYPVKTSYIDYPDQKTYKGANVKVYTYDRASLITVFSATGMKMSEADLSKLSKVMCFNLSGSGLKADQVKFPADAPVSEFSMAGCGLTDFPWGEQYKETLQYLNLSSNSIKTFDASALPGLRTLSLDRNGLKSIHFDNEQLWGVSLLDNELESIDLNGLDGLDQIDLSNNLLSAIDLEPVKATIKVLMMSANNFNFGTLPLQSDYWLLNVYDYGGQAMLQPTCTDGVIDLAYTAFAKDGTESTFTWWLGLPEWDYENYTWVGTVLEEGVDYTIDGGVTTFLHPMSDDVMAFIENETFPQLTLYTDLTNVDLGSLDSVLADGQDGPVDVYTTTGLLVRRQAQRADALRGLAPGCYIVGNRKVMVK